MRKKCGFPRKFQNILNHISQLAEKNQNLSSFKSQQDQFLQSQWEKLWRKNLPLLTSQFSKQFWGNLDKATKYKIETQRTAPWNGTLIKEDGQICWGSEADQNTISHLSTLFKGKVLACNECFHPIVLFPKHNFIIPTSSKTRDKAISIDLIPHSLLNSKTEMHKLQNNWTKELLNQLSTGNQLPTSFIGRLFFLNKIHPLIPNLSQLRPITILSPLRTAIEEIILGKIKYFCQHKIHKSQTGFQPFLGTEVNL